MINLGKKGKKLNNAFLESAVVFIVLVVLFMSIYSVLVPEAQTAGNQLNDSNRCTAVGCFYNGSRVSASTGNFTCTASNGSITDPNECANGANSIPLASLFGGSGVIFVVLMAALLIVLIRAALIGIKGKK